MFLRSIQLIKMLTDTSGRTEFSLLIKYVEGEDSKIF